MWGGAIGRGVESGLDVFGNAKLDASTRPVYYSSDLHQPAGSCCPETALLNIDDIIDDMIAYDYDFAEELDEYPEDDLEVSSNMDPNTVVSASGTGSFNPFEVDDLPTPPAPQITTTTQPSAFNPFAPAGVVDIAIDDQPGGYVEASAIRAFAFPSNAGNVRDLLLAGRAADIRFVSGITSWPSRFAVMPAGSSQALLAGLAVTSSPLIVNGSKVIYKDGPAGIKFAQNFVDLSLLPGIERTALFLLARQRQQQLYVTTNFVNQTTGSSWHCSLYAALAMAPDGMVYTGGSQSPGDVTAKARAAAASKRPLFVYNPSAETLTPFKTGLSRRWDMMYYPTQNPVRPLALVWHPAAKSATDVAGHIMLVAITRVSVQSAVLENRVAPEAPVLNVSKEANPTPVPGTDLPVVDINIDTKAGTLSGPVTNYPPTNMSALINRGMEPLYWSLIRSWNAIANAGNAGIDSQPAANNYARKYAQATNFLAPKSAKPKKRRGGNSTPANQSLVSALFD
jgi:hypothetical protein